MKSYLKTFALMLLVSAISVGSFVALVQYFSQQESVQTQKTATFFARTIDESLGRLAHLPFVLSHYPAVADALAENDGTTLDPLLHSFAVRANADQIFLMDINGQTIAASNYQSPNSFIGNFYTFRPYFRQAILGNTGRFYAIGATTGEPGYFISAPVYDHGGNVFGVVVVKTSLQALTQAWQQSGMNILVSNADSVVVLASTRENQFRTLQPLSTHARLTLEKAQQFGDEPLLPLDWQVGKNGQAVLNGTPYLLTRHAIAQEDWTLNLLSDLSGIRQQAALIVAGALVLLLGMIIASIVFRSARLRKALAQSDAARGRLQAEIEVRKATETELTAAQDALERTSRLAALGQLSASITHELGQPISAMRNYLAAEEISREVAPDSLNPVLSGLVDRMQNINNQLRGFASPGIRSTLPFDLREACDAALELVAHSLAAKDITLVKTYAEVAVVVSGSQPQIEQVLINLLRNALDALDAQSVREITVQVGHSDTRAFVRVADTGPGLGGRSLADLETPFMTTKPSGQGMGLGLAISAQIAKDMKGRLEATERAEGGAVFTLWLPLSEGET